MGHTDVLPYGWDSVRLGLNERYLLDSIGGLIGAHDWYVGEAASGGTTVVWVDSNNVPVAGGRPFFEVFSDIETAMKYVVRIERTQSGFIAGPFTMLRPVNLRHNVEVLAGCVYIHGERAPKRPAKDAWFYSTGKADSDYERGNQ